MQNTDTRTAAHIPDEAVQVAVMAYSKQIDYNDNHDDAVKAAITAALPHLSAPCAVEVVKLKWYQTDKKGDWWAAETCLSENGFADYGIRKEDGWYFTVGDEPMIKTKGDENWPSVQEAKAAAQADFERRILSCVITKPVDVAAVRRQAHEEAAELLDQGFDMPVEKAWRNDGQPSKNDKCPHDKFMYEDCMICASAAIRALSAEPALGDQRKPIETARLLEEWHEDYGDVVWWAWDDIKKEWLGEAPFISHPLSSDWPCYHTHWTPLPKLPAAPTTEAGK